MGIEHLILNLHLSFAISLSVSGLIIHVFLGLIVWFPVRFNSGKNNILSSIINILVTAIIVVLIWVYIPMYVSSALYPVDVQSIQFINNTVFYRIQTEILLFIVVLLVYYMIIYNTNLEETLANESKLKILVREAELNMLKSQVNPHFLFNSLNSVSLLTRKDPVRAREMIISLSEFLRYSLKYDENEMTTFREELSNMDRYLEIEKIRFGDKLKYKKEVDENILSEKVPNMILQPLFENAVKHGVYESIEPITIELFAKKTKGNLEISLKNNFDPEAIGRKGAGIGLKNTSERLHLLYGKSPLVYVSSKNGVFEVTLKIPKD